MTKKEWLNSILASYKLKYNPSSSEVEHILDFLDKKPSTKLSSRVSYLSIKKKSEAWTLRLNKKNKNLKESGQVELVISFTDGGSFVRLLDQTAKNWEGKHMGHCVASYTSHEGIYSLRDEENIPHCTVEVVQGRINQIKGKGNTKVVFKYHNQVLEGIKKKGFTLTRRDIEHIGYLTLDRECISVIKKNFTNDTWLSLEGVEYFNVHSKLKLISPLVNFDLTIFNLITQHQVDCLSAFKRLLELLPSAQTGLSAETGILKLMCYQGRVAYVKAIVDYLHKSKTKFTITHQVVASAIDSGKTEIVNLLLEEDKAQREKRAGTNPYSKFISRKENISLNDLVDYALGKNKAAIVMSLLNMGAKIKVEYIPEAMNLAVKENNSELLKVCLAASSDCQLSIYTQHAYKLYSEGKKELFTLMSQELGPREPKYVSDLFYIWFKNYNSGSLEFLDFIIAHHGFKEADYLATLRNILVSSHTELIDEFAKRGADFKFNNGEALILALRHNRLALSIRLINEGCLDLLRQIPAECEASLRIIARDFLEDKEEEFLINFAKKMEQSGFTKIVELLLLGGVKLPEMRKSLIDKAAGLTASLLARKIKSVELEAELDSFAKNNGLFSENWVNATLADKQASREEFELKERRKNEVITTDFRSRMEAVIDNDRRRFSSGRITRDRQGNYIDKRDGRVFRSLEELHHSEARRITGRGMRADGRVYDIYGNEDD